MKKKVFLITLLTAVLTLSACGGSPTTALPTDEPVTPTETVSQPTEPPIETETSAPTLEAPTATEAAVTENTSAAISFLTDIKPILDARCIKCHGVEQTKEGLDLQTYENIFAGSRKGPVVEPGNAADSLLVQLIVEGEMPNRGEPVTPGELQLIIDWVNQGALNN